MKQNVVTFQIAMTALTVKFYRINTIKLFTFTSTILINSYYYENVPIYCTIDQLQIAYHTRMFIPQLSDIQAPLS